MAKRKYYAVARGRETGIFRQWFGPRGAERLVRGYKAARFKGFGTREEAEAFLTAEKESKFSETSVKPLNRRCREQKPYLPDSVKKGEIVLYTDGGCLNNPGPGGWGAVVVDEGERKELSGGFRRTTNNRMELKACIEGLKAAKPGVAVLLFTDSRYVADGISKGWAERWRRNGWMRTRTEKALNSDLWAELLELCEMRRVDFNWVKGHAGIPENERCDQLAGDAARRRDLPPDPGFEA